jgi:hypothetical protein
VVAFGESPGLGFEAAEMTDGRPALPSSQNALPASTEAQPPLERT